MVRIRDFDAQLTRIERFGASGDLPTTMSADAKIDELSRQNSELRKAVELLIRHARQGPDWERPYRVSYADVDADNVVEVVHDLGYSTGDWIVVRTSSIISRASGATVAYWSALRMLNADERSVRFQLSTDAVAKGMIYYVAPMSQALVARSGAAR